MSVKAKSATCSAAAGLVASLCCGGSLVFASIGLGAFFSALGLWRYIPQVLAAGALFIVAINYFYYRHLAKRVPLPSKREIVALRQGMFMSASLGIAAMAVSFVFLEWLNHAVVNPHRFLSRPEYGQALVPGVPNIRLIYAITGFSALALLWAMPFPNFVPELSSAAAALRMVVRVGVFLATVAVLVALIVNPVRFGGAGGDTPKHGSGRHSGP